MDFGEKRDGDRDHEQYRHQRGQRLVHALQQAVEHERHEDEEGLGDEVGHDAAAEEGLRRQDVVGRGRGVAVHDEGRRHVHQTIEAGNRKQHVQQTYESCELFGRGHGARPLLLVHAPLRHVTRPIAPCNGQRTRRSFCCGPQARVRSSRTISTASVPRLRAHDWLADHERMYARRSGSRIRASADCLQSDTWQVGTQQASLTALATLTSPQRNLVLVEWNVPPSLVGVEVSGADVRTWSRTGARSAVATTRCTPPPIAA